MFFYKMPEGFWMKIALTGQVFALKLDMLFRNGPKVVKNSVFYPFFSWFELSEHR